MGHEEHSPQVDVIAVIGAGVMGRGIAQVAAGCGFEVRLHDVSAAALEGALGSIRTHLAHAVDKGKIPAEVREATLKNLVPQSDLLSAVAGAQMVIEATPERIALKRDLFARLGEMVARDVILATNTSSLSVTEIAAAATCPERVIGLHFFNPPYVIKLLELVRAEQTSEATVAVASETARRMDRQLVVVNDSAGFASSRLGVILGLEAMRMVEQGVASAQDIDRAMELGYRHPMGPLKVSDLVGLDVRLAIAEYLHAEIGEQFRPPQILRRLVRAGKLGKKTGEGFYRW